MAHQETDRSDGHGTARSVRFLHGVLGGLSAFAMLFMMALTLVDVTGRSVISRPVPGSYEIIEFGLAIVVFSALPLVSWNRQHITVAILNGLFARYAYRAHQIFVQLISVVGFALVAYCMYLQWRKLGATQAITGYLEWPIAPIALFMFCLALVGLAVGLWLLWCALQGRDYPAVLGEHQDID